MFRGFSFQNIDGKGRVVVPARFREVIREAGPNGVFLSRIDGCLVGYTKDQWNRIEARILSLAETSQNIRKFRRVFIGGASECDLDKQERILIPPGLREYAGLEKEIVMVGVLDHFEIWSREAWDQENSSMENDIQNEEVRNEIAKLGL